MGGSVQTTPYKARQLNMWRMMTKHRMMSYDQWAFMNSIE
jgi:hypothetical protein